MGIDPATLLNSDAGAWNVRCTVTGAHTRSITQQASVVRRSRLSFNAGPEPVRNHRLTYSGKPERASWYSKRYISFGGRTVMVDGYFGNQEDYGPVALPETAADGTYRAAECYRGPRSYSALFTGAKTTAGWTSRQDRVDSAR